ncbi:uracil-DNA glycosylase [Paenibacillus sp. DMB5]|nr:uracil-DNA glycosylase [Paenibacillus sp. DMB5]
MATFRNNITLAPAVCEELCKYVGKKNIKISTWTHQRMKELIEEEKMIEEFRKSGGR